MEENKGISRLYPKEHNCPICDSKFQSMRLRESTLKIEKHETDLNILYYDVQPSFYQIIVCPTCGFSGVESKYKSLRPAQKDIIMKTIINKWDGRNYSSERTLDDAIVTWLLAIGIADIAQFSSLELGMYSLILSRLYRIKNNENMEYRFIKAARDKLIDAYSEDDYTFFPRMNSGKVSYLIGELSRKLKDKKNASTFMSIALKDDFVKSDAHLIELAREQWLLIKELAQEEPLE